MTMLTTARRRWVASGIAALALFAALWGLNTWMASIGEDRAPVWNCHTMGNLQCGPDSPWHGFYIGAAVPLPATTPNATAMRYVG